MAALYVSFGVLTWQRAKDCVSADVLFIIAAAFGLGNALQDTGAADAVASRWVGGCWVGVGGGGLWAYIYVCVCMCHPYVLFILP